MRCPHLALLALAHAASADESARQRGAGDDAAAPAGPVAGAADEGETAAGVPPGRYEANWDSWRVRLNAPEENGIEYPDIVDDDEDDDPALHSEMDLEQRRRWRSDEEAKFACPSSNGPLRGVRRMFMKLCCDA